MNGAEAEKNGVKTRNTKQKTLILSCLKENDHRHITAEEIAEMLKNRGEPVGIATVYRNLKQLEGENIVKRYTTGQRSVSCYRFLGTDNDCADHFHLICENCGCVVHVEDYDIKNAVKEINRLYDFEIDNSRTVFYGQCTACRRTKTEKEN